MFPFLSVTYLHISIPAGSKPGSILKATLMPLKLGSPLLPAKSLIFSELPQKPNIVFIEQPHIVNFIFQQRDALQSYAKCKS